MQTDNASKSVCIDPCAIEAIVKLNPRAPRVPVAGAEHDEEESHLEANLTRLSVTGI